MIIQRKFSGFYFFNLFDIYFLHFNYDWPIKVYNFKYFAK